MLNAQPGRNILDHVYTNVDNAYKNLPCPHLGLSDHLSQLMVPAYKPLINRIKPTSKVVRVWPEGAMLQLQDCFEYRVAGNNSMDL